MQAIKCELCGSSDIMKQDGFFQCQNCGTKYNLEEARKLIGIVKIDRSDEINNLYTLARRYYDEKNFVECEKYYELVLREAPNDWEPVFFRAYANAINTRNLHMADATKVLVKAIPTSIKLIHDYTEPNEQDKAIETVYTRVSKYIDNTSKLLLKREDYKWVSANIISLNSLLMALVTQLKTYFPNKTTAIREVQRILYDDITAYTNVYPKKERNELISGLKAELQI